MIGACEAVVRDGLHLHDGLEPGVPTFVERVRWKGSMMPVDCGRLTRVMQLFDLLNGIGKTKIFVENRLL